MTKMHRVLRRALAGAALAAGLLTAPGCVAISESGDGWSDALQGELFTLRAREDIRELIHAYGRTLDARDWGGFEELWAQDAVYGGGAGGAGTVGPEAIADSLKQIFAANPSGLEGPTAHIFFNEHIEVSGDRATGSSMGAFVAGAEGGRAEMVILATYEDEYVMEGGRWKFARRVIRGVLPAPAAPQ